MVLYFPLYEIFNVPSTVINNNYGLWLCVPIIGSFLVADQIARVLFDSGSSFSFISESFTAEIGSRPAKISFHLNVVTPLGEHSLAWRYLRSVDIKLGNQDFKADLINMDMKEYDVLLGMN